MPRSILLIPFALLSGILGLGAQTPQSKFSYEDRSGTTGHTIAVDGKTFGPYKEVTSVNHSTSGSAGLFLVTKRDKTYVLAQGKEWGPLPSGYDPDQVWISDDGKIWAVSAVRYYEDEEGTTEAQLIVNGKTYGPFTSVYAFDYAEVGGHWLATVELGSAEDQSEYDILFDGKTRGPFASVEHSWVFPDGKGWGWSVTDTEGATTVVTQDRTWERVQSTVLDQMYPRSPHWAMGLRIGDEEELIVVDGKNYSGYLNFSGLYTTYSGRHWGFQAEKLADGGDYPVVVIDGKEYVGEGLETSSLGDRELFTWTVTDGTKVTVQVLNLP